MCCSAGSRRDFLNYYAKPMQAAQSTAATHHDIKLVSSACSSLSLLAVLCSNAHVGVLQLLGAAACSCCAVAEPGRVMPCECLHPATVLLPSASGNARHRHQGEGKAEIAEHSCDCQALASASARTSVVDTTRRPAHAKISKEYHEGNTQSSQ